MRARLAILVAAVTVLLSPALPASADGGGHPCPTGTNWDNSIRNCK